MRSGPLDGGRLQVQRPEQIVGCRRLTDRLLAFGCAELLREELNAVPIWIEDVEALAHDVTPGRPFSKKRL